MIADGSYVTFVGDSVVRGGGLSGGYTSHLKRWYPKCKFATSGVSGENILGLAKRFDRSIINTSKRPTHCIIAEGRNDIGNDHTKPAEVPLNVFKTTLGTLLDKCLSAGIVPIVSTIALAGECWQSANPLDARIAEYTVAQAEVAFSRNASLIDMRNHFITYEEQHNHHNLSQGVLTKDGTHFNSIGYFFMASTFASYLDTL